MSSINKIIITVFITVFITALVTALFTYLFLAGNNLTSNSNKDVSFQQKKECQKMGEDYYQKDLIDAEEITVSGQFSIGTPTYGYSKVLDTCIYINSSLLYVKNLDTRESRYVVDLMTNEDLERSVYATKPGEYVDKYSHGLTREEFDAFVSQILQ